MAVYEDQRFHNRTLELDGNSYRDCHFINCQFRFRGHQAFAFEHNRLEGAFWLHFIEDWKIMPGAIDPLRLELRRYGINLDEALTIREADWASRGTYLAFLQYPERHIEYWFHREGKPGNGHAPIDPDVPE